MVYVRGLIFLCLGLMSAAVYAQEAGTSTPSSVYVDIKPAFVVNYGGVGKLRYIKTTITLRIEDGVGQSHVRRHMPYLRHKLVMLLSQATEEDISSMTGKELLRQNALAAVREVLMQEEGQQSVMDLLFSSFIVQS